MKIKASIFAAALALSIAATQALPAAAITSSSTDYGSYTIEQLEALIAKLQKQLTEMRQGSKCFVSDRDLSIGDGEADDGFAGDVKRLQDFLREKGHYSYKSTGYFGKITRAAVLSFQRKEAIAQSGEFDAATRAKAHAMYCKGVIKPKQEVKKDPSYEKKETEKKPEAQSSVKSIWLAAGEAGRVHWKVDGHSSMGFKVVWSKTAGPTYPNRDADRYQYYDSPSANQTQLEAFDGAGTYYVRVCQYLGGACGTYSNEVKVQL